MTQQQSNNDKQEAKQSSKSLPTSDRHGDANLSS